MSEKLSGSQAPSEPDLARRRAWLKPAARQAPCPGQRLRRSGHPGGVFGTSCRVRR